MSDEAISTVRAMTGQPFPILMQAEIKVEAIKQVI
jgi:hypothetical protein